MWRNLYYLAEITDSLMIRLTRKVIRGTDSCYFTLPAAWLRTYDVRPGSLLDVVLEGKSLKIRIAGASAVATEKTPAPTPGQEAGTSELAGSG